MNTSDQSVVRSPISESASPILAMQVAAQQAIMRHPFFDGSAASAFGFAGAAVKAALEVAGEKDEELKAAYERIKELEYLISDLDEYFDDRADADCDQDGFIPNEEMRMLSRIREVLP